jgi:membrane protease YdiL (CAAX protease family)
VDERASTARPQRSPADPAASTARLAAWTIFVGLLIAVDYASRATEGTPDRNGLYHWSSAVAAVVQDAVFLGIVLAIARGARELLAWRRPDLSLRGWLLVPGIVLVTYVFEDVYAALVHLGNEQGLTPDRWEPSHWPAYVVNAVVICTWVPLVEETLFRGLGFSLLRPFGRWPAIVAIGVLFGLYHGLLLSLPVLILFGGLLAWLRARTDSVVPGIVAHGLFNLIALVAAVAT